MLPAVIGLSLALTGCPEGSSSNGSVVFDEADEQLFVQPIQVCSDNGSNCASVNLFEDITRKILEQARLKVSFLPTAKLNASRFLTIEDVDRSRRNSADYEFYELTRTGDNEDFGRHPNSTETSGPINVWFVDEIEAINGFTQFGLAWVDANGVLISEESATFNNGQGRPDTLAHEIGHNLGLRHSTFGAGSPNNLLTDGDVRNIPRSAADVGPGGAGLSQLNSRQIKEILESPFVNRNATAILGREVEAADVATLSADEARQLLTRLASSGYLDGIDSTLLAQADLDRLKSQATGTTDTKTVPEPAGIAGLGVLVLLLLASARSSAYQPSK